MIADEVITAFGRLGRWFGSERLRDRARPDHGREGTDVRLLPALGLHRLGPCVARARRRLGKRAVRPRVHVLRPSACGGRRDDEPRPDRERRARRPGCASAARCMNALLHEAFDDHPLVGEVRGTALIGGSRVRRAQGSCRARSTRRSRSAARVTRRCLELGLITRALPAADTISFSPPFVITEDEVGELVRITRQAVDEVAAELRSEA